MSTAGRLRSILAPLLLAWSVVGCSIVYAQEPQDNPSPGLFSEPAVLARIAGLVERRTATRRPSAPDGFFADFGRDMVTGGGWIAAGPGYRRHLLHGRALWSSSAVLSWRLYTTATTRFEFQGLLGGHATVGAQALYGDALQVNYFGMGNATSFQRRSGYRSRSADGSIYTQFRSGRALAFGARVGWLGYNDISPMSGLRLPDYPDIHELFTEASAPGLSQQPHFVHLELTARVDTRDSTADTSHGGLYRASAAHYVDRDTGRFTFSRYELEAAQYFTLVPDRVTVAVRGWTVLDSVTIGHDVPFYLLPTIGGRGTLRGFTDFRFADRNMEVFNIESRLRVYAHVDFAVFADAGKVAARASDLDLSHLHPDAGVGLRFRTRNITVARLDVARGAEGWYAVFRLTEPFRRKRGSSGFPLVVPFVP